MSFFKKVKDAVNAGHSELTNQVGRFKNRKFMEGTVAVCACISMASDGASAEEKQKMMSFIQQSEELAVFDVKEVIGFFNTLATGFEFDVDIGKGEAMKYVMRLKDQPDAAQLALRVGIAVAKSDGDFDDSEKAIAREICVALGFSTSEYQL
ncbi:tellurite resistance TerB family protein [Photobacterium japonica]|uniref:tellurite resistance TerB family protein n=1 Tax=Photobacterium japonica TaxID=2910235 RepID=UPI003D0C703A